MNETLKKHASLRGVSNANDEANQLSWFHIRTEECQDCTFSLLSKLTEFRRGQSASVTILTDFAALNRLGCRAHIRSLAMTQCAFTMAEILLSLTIIGVVAAITLPSLMANINERTWNTQRKALYARMSQAIAMMPQLNGYGEYEGTNTDGSVTATKDTAAEAFLTEGLSKVLKINNICDAAHLADCGIAASFTNLAGSTISWPTKLSELNPLFTSAYITSSGSVFDNPQKNIDTKTAAFETQNGETIALYYNPYCKADVSGKISIYAQPLMCANFIYDLNGNKGPNAVGKDIGFITALYPYDSNVVAPMPLNIDAAGETPVVQTKASAACLAQNSETRLPNIDELSAMYYNVSLSGLTQGAAYWSSSVSTVSGTRALCAFGIPTGHRYCNTSAYTSNVRCVKR